MINLLKTHPFFLDKTIDSCTLLENQGYCNENYLVVVDGIKYIVRKLLRDDIDRAFEWRVQNLAFEKNITAKPLVFDEENGFMVFEFLEGEHKSKPDINELKLLAQTLQKLHCINIDANLIDLQMKNKTDEIQKAFKTIQGYKKEYVLCHNDLNSQNIFFLNDVKFIDWEYAGVNDIYFDLACVSMEFKLDDEMQNLFMNAYFENDAYTLDKLDAYKVVYRALCEEWFSSNL